MKSLVILIEAVQWDQMAVGSRSLAVRRQRSVAVVAEGCPGGFY